MENNWEDKIKKIKGEKDFKVDISDKVMEKINLVKMKSSYYFKSKKLMLLTLFSLSLLAGVFIVNLAMYDISEGNSLEYASFGLDGLALIMKNLPYLLILSIAVFVFLASWLLSKLEISYNKSFAVLLIILVASTFVGGGAIFAFDVNDAISEKVSNDEIKAPLITPLAKVLYERHGPRMLGDEGLVGLVDGVPAPEGKEFWLRTPQGQTIKVRLVSGCKVVSGQRALASGDVIVIMGNPMADFQARGIKVIDDKARAAQIMEKLKRQTIHIEFRQSEPIMLKDLNGLPKMMQMNDEFLNSMGGMLQAAPQSQNVNIYIGPGQ